MKIVVLNDDRCDNNELECEHGLSLYVEVAGHKFLFDVGQTDKFILNAQKLGVNLDEAEFFVLSHGDYDHGNGLRFFDKKVKLFAHPDIFKKRISKRTGKFAGLDLSEDAIKAKFDFKPIKSATEISKDVIFLGEIARKNLNEVHLAVTNLDGSENLQLDDSGLAIKTKNGLVVISGCAHSGICNIIEHAKNVTGESKVYAVIGGFHLKNVDEDTKKTFEYFEKNKIEKILPCHCNSDEICKAFEERFAPQTTILKTGMTVIFD